MKNKDINVYKMALEIIKKNGDYGFDTYKHIQYKNGFCNVTDGRILLMTNLFYDDGHEGKLINPKNLRVFKEGDESYRKFPDLQKLLDSFNEHKIIDDGCNIPEFIFHLGAFGKHDICLIYLNDDGSFSINKTENVLAALDMRYMKFLKYLYPEIPNIKAKDEKSAVIFEYGDPIHTKVILMPVKI